ncbi:MAG: hypothetical protein QME55_12075 [Brevundimonas sp.]|uniref:hypothetical protein n=1 Tax=Brevundimonas sp. TaxID=1871086 RepID=UPI0027E76E91|nr:hypothetical protein [Brevundimonas sp.]MDI6625460.1 hypothetical protein [Brevundimonas sp.]MDQ7814090.1 hypothetical protein [Brevundimonas sp.]
MADTVRRIIQNGLDLRPQTVQCARRQLAAREGVEFGVAQARIRSGEVAGHIPE